MTEQLARDPVAHGPLAYRWIVVFLPRFSAPEAVMVRKNTEMGCAIYFSSDSFVRCASFCDISLGFLEIDRGFLGLGL